MILVNFRHCIISGIYGYVNKKDRMLIYTPGYTNRNLIERR